MGRREFVTTGAAAGALMAGGGSAFGQAPTVAVPKTVKPVVVGSANGNVYKNGGPRTAVAEAFERIAKGEDVLAPDLSRIGLEWTPALMLADPLASTRKTP